MTLYNYSYIVKVYVVISVSVIVYIIIHTPVWLVHFAANLQLYH